jgi:NADH:ubiquinone oxidoreductase subunit 6 (subunit J)
MARIMAAYSTTLNNKTPINLLLLIILNRTLMSYAIFLKTLRLWAATLLMIVYVRGVMVLFIYIVSLSPMEKNALKKTKTKILIATTVMLMAFRIAPQNSLKNMSKFIHTFEKTISIIVIRLVMLVIIRVVIPSTSITHHKGLKTSK